MFREIERRIFVDDFVFENELALTKDNATLVYFQYYNKKRDKTGKVMLKTYNDALALARSRTDDGRYKNYEFLIYKQ